MDGQQVVKVGGHGFAGADLEDDADVDRYKVAFAELCAIALSEEASRMLIERVLGELKPCRKEQDDRLA